jgi:Phosphoglycerate dehydrogenase and related dehydrogenases
MYKIKLFNKIASIGTDHFDKSLYIVKEDIENPDAIMVRSASMHEAELPDGLKAIARAGAGVNNIPIEKCSEKGVVVFNTPGANANAVKELAVAALLLSSRKIVSGISWAQTLKEGSTDVAKDVEKGKGAYVGPELSGKKLGIIGLGAIGVQLANISVHLGMQVYGYDPYITVDAAWMLSKTVAHAASLGEIYKDCDYISIHVPSTPETKGMINSETISQMKDGVRILNLARADLVDATSIKAAVTSGKVATYVTDFPTEDILGIENIIPIPHLGASTPESEDNCAEMAALELIDFLQYGNIKNSVNFPEVFLPFSGGVRICVFHKNIPSMLTQISSVLSNEKINIENMVNRSKKDNAYTLIETTSEISNEVSAKLTAIDGVIKVRTIK